MEMSGQLHALVALFPENNPGTHSTGGCVGLRASLGVSEKSILPLLRFEPRNVQPVA